ncbi:MAG: hypothetical protein MJZ90_07400 [Bacteroidales bacterium]|nr:hypothetical protein [Bacteroidales bacterium]
MTEIDLSYSVLIINNLQWRGIKPRRSVVRYGIFRLGRNRFIKRQGV